MNRRERRPPVEELPPPQRWSAEEQRGDHLHLPGQPPLEDRAGAVRGGGQRVAGEHQEPGLLPEGEAMAPEQDHAGEVQWEQEVRYQRVLLPKTRQVLPRKSFVVLSLCQCFACCA